MKHQEPDDPLLDFAERRANGVLGMMLCIIPATVCLAAMLTGFCFIYALLFPASLGLPYEPQIYRWLALAGLCMTLLLNNVIPRLFKNFERFAPISRRTMNVLCWGSMAFGAFVAWSMAD